MQTTNVTTEGTKIDPCAWDIKIGWRDGDVDVINVVRLDGLPFEHTIDQIVAHVDPLCRALCIDPGTQPAAFVNGRTVCVLRD